MNRIVPFFLRMAVASAVAALLFIMYAARRDDETQRWRSLAYQAESQLAQLKVVRDRPESASPQREMVSKPVAALRAPAQERFVPPQPASLPQLPPPAPSVLDPDRQEEWTALVTGALQSEVQRRLGHALPPEQEQRLVETLARLRDTSLGLGEESVDTEDPAALRDRLARTLVLLEADRTFRTELGIGVSDFLQGLNGGQIEEVFPVEPTSEPVR